MTVRARGRPWRAGLVAGLAALQLACGTPPLPPGAPPLVLVGEVHDNPAQPALQADALRELLRSGWRPALLLEPFDRERQTDIDRAHAGGADAARLIAAASDGAASRWDWARYRPLIEIALAHGLPIVAANVSRADTRRVMAEGLAAHGFDAQVPEALLAAQARTIERSHCGMVDAAMARRMALAQVARDQFMARQLQAHAGRGALLVAGHGHVRRDIGAPHWLPPTERERASVLGLLEPGSAAVGFDRSVVSAPPAREDPCASLRAIR